MSWMKRRTPTATPSPGPMQTPPPPVQMYNPNQHSNQDWQPPANNWYNNQPMPTVSEHQNQQTYWQPQQYSQQPQQQQQQPPQQQQHQQQQQQQYHYGNQQQNNYYPQQPQQQQQQPYETYNNVQYAAGYNNQANNTFMPPQQPQQQPAQVQQQQPDGWNSAWGWGDEDNSNLNPNVQLNANIGTNAVGNVPVADSFTNDKSWNWNVEESSLAKQEMHSHAAEAPAGNVEVANDVQHEDLFPKMATEPVSHKMVKPENLETPLLPALSLSRHKLKSEPLTPQWSIESQVSQESSDEVLHTSESDKLFSRSSTISHSPVSGQQTPLDIKQEVGVIGQYDNCENKEIVGALKEEEEDDDIKLPPPPMVQMQSNNTDNPYKKSSAGSLNKHRTTPPSDPTTTRSFYIPPPMNQSVNLETLPDNSEAPDVTASFPEVPSAPVTPLENNEVAPLNERNQYLETGQLSDDNDALPPPGLRRMVLGQNENPHHTASPPVGLHRMVPGESSSPEARYPHDEEEASDPELQQINRNPMQSRSATIGADTPPAPPASSRPEVVEQRETHLDGANTLDSTTTTDLDNLTSSVRDLTVGENTSDNRPPGDSSVRRLETDSDVDAGPQSTHERKDRRHKEKRYSPPEYPPREKSRNDRRRPRDRNYEEDTDYYSDKERDRRREERERGRGGETREDYDKKYSSLRRGDKEPARRRRDDRGDRDRRGDYRREREYYYNRYEEEYDEVHRSSRPSSRSDSMHDSTYRQERDRRRERDQRRHRDPYNAYKMPGGYQYDPYSPYFQQYQYYLENLRRTDPQAYAEWYRKYYQQSGAAGSTYTQEEKTSVHSGRSSTNDDLAKERYLRQSYYGHAGYPQMGGYYREPHSHSVSGHYGLDDSRPYDYTDSSLVLDDTTTTASQRLTPAKFSTAHIKASIASGRFLKILPHYPMDGQSALIELDRVQDYLQCDDELVELEQFPGPLVRGVTHKKTIIEYCNNKIRDHAVHRDIDDPESYVLMWELLILLIRQNGMVVGADIAELLMKDRNSENVMQRPASVASTSSGIVEVSEGSNAAEVAGSTSTLKEEYVTNKFREYLIYGSGQQALEWAMKHSLWGHALFLASKLDKRTYAKVMMRFANGLPINDPLQTLYQLLSGHLPAAVTSVSDEKWGDWRPHLAMILSNTTQRPELDRKAITTLAETLMSRGSLYAAQFCYLMAEVGFSRYGQDGKLVLLGGDSSKPFMQFAHNEAIHMTEIYEYACSLNDPAFKIPEFQAYKYLMATRLADRGFLESALAYVEQVAIALAAIPSLAQPSLINKVCDLAEQLKYYDPVAYSENDEGHIEPDGDGADRPDPSWLQELKTVQQQYTMGLISHESVNNLNAMTPETAGQQQQVPSYEHSPQDPWTQNTDNQYNQQQVSNSWQAGAHVEPVNDYNQQQTELTEGFNAQYQPEQVWNQQQPVQQWNADPQQDTGYNTSQQQSQELHSHLDQQNVQQQSNDYWNNAQIEPEEKKEPEQPRPQISMPNQSHKENESHQQQQHASSPAKVKPKSDLDKSGSSSSGTGWFGGIWSKLALRPKNQMKLPDDKNPTIVWDQEKKRWVNLEGDGTDAVSELKPPPKMADFMQQNRKLSTEMMPPPQHHHMHPPQQQQSQPQSLPNMMPNAPFGMGGTASQPQSLDVHPHSDAKPPLPSQNMFKMQRGRNLKKSYVDVFNPSGKAPSPPAPAPTDGSFPSMAPNAAFFVPAPMDPNAPMDFLTPSSMGHLDPNAQAHQS